MRLAFDKKSAVTFVALFLIEVLIAVFINDRFVRPFVGDLLIVLLMYAFIRMFIDVRNRALLAVCILAFAYLVEIGQYFGLVASLGLADSKIAKIIVGTSFDWRDILAYTLGFGVIICLQLVQIKSTEL